MRIVVTGGAGFIGRRLAQRLLDQGSIVTSDGQEKEISELVVCDVVAPDPRLPDDSRLRVFTGDLSDKSGIRELVTSRTAAVFHLAAVVSHNAARFRDGNRWRYGIFGLKGQSIFTIVEHFYLAANFRPYDKQARRHSFHHAARQAFTFRA